MADVLKNDLKSVDVFFLLFKGTDNRFLSSIPPFMKLYEEIFSKDLWKHAITGITWWKWDDTAVEDRLVTDNCNVNANVETQATDFLMTGILIK